MQGCAISRSTDETDSKSNDRYAVLSSSLSIGFSPHRTTNAEIAGVPVSPHVVTVQTHPLALHGQTNRCQRIGLLGGNLWGSVGRLHLHLDASAKLSDIIAAASTVPSSPHPLSLFPPRGSHTHSNSFANLHDNSCSHRTAQSRSDRQS
jgi:hypothetical protein